MPKSFEELTPDDIATIEHGLAPLTAAYGPAPLTLLIGRMVRARGIVDATSDLVALVHAAADRARKLKGSPVDTRVVVYVRRHWMPGSRNAGGNGTFLGDYLHGSAYVFDAIDDAHAYIRLLNEERYVLEYGEYDSPTYEVRPYRGPSQLRGLVPVPYSSTQEALEYALFEEES